LLPAADFLQPCDNGQSFSLYPTPILTEMETLFFMNLARAAGTVLLAEILSVNRGQPACGGLV